MGTVRFTLTPAEAAEIQKPVNGSGGYQTLLRQLQVSLKKNGSITLDDDALGRVVRMCAYGSGGFQGRLRAAFKRSVRDLVVW